MRKSAIIVLSATLMFLLQGCGGEPSTARRGAKIAATIFPLHDITKNVAGDKLEVVGILPPGASPHTYAPSPREVKRLEGVAIVFSIGHGLDDWTNILIETLPGAKRVVVDSGVHLVESAAAEEKEGEHERPGAGHRHAGANPHYWLSIGNGKQIARNIAAEIVSLDPANEGYYRANLKAYLLELDDAERRIKDRLRQLPEKKMITFHDAWIYYAEEFGLELIGAFEPFPGKQPTPRHLAALHEKVRRHKVTALFSEPQLSGETVASFVNDLGLKLYVLDPLGGSEGRKSYIELLEYNTDIIVEALSDGR